LTKKLAFDLFHKKVQVRMLEAQFWRWDAIMFSVGWNMLVMWKRYLLSPLKLGL